MSTAEEGWTTAITTTSSYGGGAGGKLRKKPFRRLPTPYDRPPTGLRVNNTSSDSSSSWLTNLVKGTAFKLISYGAGLFVPSVFRKRLTPPPPLPSQPPETETLRETDGDQGEGLNSQGGEQGNISGQCSLPINIFSSNGVTELEHLLKQKTFTRSQIAHLTELLLSRVASPDDASQKIEVPALDSVRQKEFASSFSRDDALRSSSVMFTPMQNSKVLESDIASPAELARAYMGSRASQISPTVLGMRNQLGKEGTGFLADISIASKSPIISLDKRTSVSLGATENGFMNPRSRGRSAIYDMARVHPNSIVKGNGTNSSGYAGPSTSSSSLSPKENDENFDSRLVTLKRRSSFLDNDGGSVGPMRRIRQRPNLLDPRPLCSDYGGGIGSHAKPKPHSKERDSGATDNESVPNTSYAHVPSKSREVASKILQQLEKFSPQEKSSSKMAAVQRNPHPRWLPAQDIQKMEDVGASKLLFNVPDGLKTGDRTNGTLFDVHSSYSKKQREENSLANTRISIVPKVVTAESDAGFHLKPGKAVNTSGRSDIVPSAAVNGTLSLSCSQVSFPVASSSDLNRISSGSAPLFTSSSIISNFVSTGSSIPSTSACSDGGTFGSTVKSSCLDGPGYKPTFSADQTTSVSAVPTASFSERADQGAGIEINPSSGCSTSSCNTDSRNGIFKFDSSLSNPTGNSLQSPLFSGATKSQVAVGTISQGITTGSVSYASVPEVNGNMKASLGVFPTSSISFGLSSWSSDTATLIPAGGPTSSPTAGSEGCAVSSSTSGSSGVFGFGGSFSASSSSSSSNPLSSISAPKSAMSGLTSTFGASSASIFSFASASGSALYSPSLPSNQPVSPVNKDQMNVEDSIDASASPSFAFGSSKHNPVVLNGQQNQFSPFQACSSSQELNGGGSFSLGRVGGDKLGRRIVKVSRNKNRNK